MIIIIGNHGCGQCEKAKRLLESKGIEFEYKILSELPATERFDVMTKARANKQASLPIILKDGEIMTVESILG